MFFEKVDVKVIDGESYDVSNGAMVDMFNCKDQIVKVYNEFDDDMLAD